jgi:penicillin-binding protein 1A
LGRFAVGFRRFLGLGLGVVAAVPAALVSFLAVLLYVPLPALVPPGHEASFAQSNVIYAANGAVLAKETAPDLRLGFSESQVPSILKDAVLSSEDHGYFQGGPISIRGTIRAMIVDLEAGAPVEGGSTITQQYVKNVYTNGSKTLARKFKEAILAGQLSHEYSKQQILYMYLSVVYFGEGAYGAAAAAERYFHEPISQLDASQSAILAGVLPAPSAYDPVTSPTLSEERRQTVLGLMLKYGYITTARYRKDLSRHIFVVGTGAQPKDATLVYPPSPQKVVDPYFVSYAEQYLDNVLSSRYGANRAAQILSDGGLKVYTTLKPDLQQAALAAVNRYLAGTKPPLSEALASVDPATGWVVAMVGGRNFAQSQVNLALGGCPAPEPAPAKLLVVPTCAAGDTVTGGGSGRQPGSSFKLFTLLRLLELGYGPTSTFNAPVTYPIPGCVPSARQDCLIHNAGGEPTGQVTLNVATWDSINTVYVQLIQRTGIEPVAELAKEMGITSAYDESDFNISYALGEIPVSPLDMASAYATVADRGVYHVASPIEKVIGANGQVLYNDSNPVGHQVVPSTIAETATQILEGVIKQGTAYPNAEIGRPAAGKTGTTNNYHDGWFVGYTPQLAAAVWMGYANNESTPLLNIDGYPQVYGGTVPAATWAAYMKRALAGVPPLAFTAPPPTSPTGGDTVTSIEPGAGRTQVSVGPGNLVVPAPTPVAVVPTTTTTTVPAPGQFGLEPSGPGPGLAQSSQSPSPEPTSSPTGPLSGLAGGLG